MDAKRGYVPDDERNFSKEALMTMKTASRHILYLLTEGYAFIMRQIHPEKKPANIREIDRENVRKTAMLLIEM